MLLVTDVSTKQPVRKPSSESAQVVETSVTNNSPSQDCNHPDDLFQSRNNCFSLLLDWVIIFMSKY